MLDLTGESGGEYFHITCANCGEQVKLGNFRWVGGVPQVKATCETCDESFDFKLDPTTWIDAVPPQ